MKRIFTLSLALSTLISCSSGPETRPVTTQLGPAFQPTYNVGDRFVWETSEGQRTDEVVSIREGSPVWRSSNGSKWISSANIVLPASSWSSPGKEEGFGNGEQSATEIRGAMFPLKVGNEMSMRVQGKSDSWPDGWDHRRNCEAKSQENITVPAGTFDTYKIVCVSGKRTRTFFFAPELGHIVYYNNYHSEKGGDPKSLVSFEQGKPRSVHP